MDWDAIIEVISDTIKDDSVRADIYKKLFDLVGIHDTEDSIGQDDAFDNVLEKYRWDDTDDDSLYEDDGDDIDYDEEE